LRMIVDLHEIFGLGRVEEGIWVGHWRGWR
jgi:hypothetical protein